MSAFEIEKKEGGCGLFWLFSFPVCVDAGYGCDPAQAQRRVDFVRARAPLSIPDLRSKCTFFLGFEFLSSGYSDSTTYSEDNYDDDCNI